ncbi:MAG: M36 family metallopeptidase [Amphiplicatus sp.]|nr:M36 family metallopeptidase [Amphiplicatus sp.]
MTSSGLKSGDLRKALALCAALSVISGVAAAQTSAQSDSDQLGARRANVFSDRADFSLARSGDARAKLRSFLSARGLDSATLDSLAQVSETADRQGRSFARFEQRIDGLRVHGAYVKAAYDADGALSHVIERTAPAQGRISRALLKPADAARIAIDANFGSGVALPQFKGETGALSQFAKTSFFHQAPSAERVVIAKGARLEEGFLVETWSEKDNLLYHTLIDSLGRVVSNELRTNEDSYNIFPVHPGVSAQTMANGPGSGNAQSPSGWLSGTQKSILIQGNNVRAYLDRDNNNNPDSGGSTITNGVFSTAANLSQDPATAQNQDVAVQNLFYLNNIIHDTLYSYGFTESAGNFQENNFGKGGRASDSVDAEAQDGGGTNNANFATPSDGSNPRMQMYLWTQSSPSRDGDVDSDVVWHEYGHGLTWRMIGSMSGNISGAIGEGMSDVLSIIQNNDDRVGEYAYNNANGIRSSRYSQHQDTIGDFNSSRGVHRNGEIYAATLWDMWQGYQTAGFGEDEIMQDIVSGMNYTPSGPDYFDMRDGLLAAAPSNRDCLIWSAFAARGMGEGGSMTSSVFSIRITESYTVPSSCSGGGGEPPPPPPEPGAPALTGLTATSVANTSLRWTATMTAHVADENGAPVSGVSVSYRTSKGATGSCTTAASGECSASVTRLSSKRDPSISFTVTALDGDTNADGVPQTVTATKP